MPDAHVHRLTDTRPIDAGGDPLSGRRLLQWNDDIEVVDLQARPRTRTASTATARATRSCSSTTAAATSRRSSAASRTARSDYVVIPRGTTYRWEPQDGEQRLAVLPHARRDRDAQPLPQPLRPAARARAVQPARLPPAGRARDASTTTAASSSDRARARRVPALRPRLPPVRRRRLGRLRLPVHVQHPRLRAQGRAPPPAAAGAPDVPGAELRDLLVLPADARLGPEAVAAALPPLEPPVRGGHLLRRRAVRLAQGRRRRADHAASERPAARAAAGPRREARSASRAPTSWR